MRIAVSELRCSLMGTTSTSGFRLRSVSAADSTLGRPMSSCPCRSWRWRLEASTTSKSTMPILPTPAGAPDLGQDQVPGVARHLVRGEISSSSHLLGLYPGPLRGYSYSWRPPDGNRIPRRRAGHLPLQQGADGQEDLAHRHLELPRGAAVRRHRLRLLDPQRHGLEGLEIG